LLTALYWLARRASGKRLEAYRRVVVVATSILVVTGFAATAYALHLGNPSRLSFLLWTRVCELLIGSLAACLPRPGRIRAVSWVVSVGLALLIAPFFLLNRTSPFPGYNALASCVGTSIILYAGQSPTYGGTWVSRLLS